MKLMHLPLLGLAIGLMALPSFALAQETSDVDPWESVNRVVFDFNQGVDYILLEPAAEAYDYVLPEFARNHVHNAIVNLNDPISAVNLVLQGRFEDAGITTLRFFTNSTAGIGGLFEITDSQNEDQQADFGQTLGSWGVGPGPYVVLPIFGPSSVRDTTGRVFDSFADPVNIYVSADNVRFADPYYFYIGRAGLTAIDTRSQLSKPIDDLKRNSFDFYATIRSVYMQRRAAKIAGGDLQDTPTTSISDYDAAAAEDQQ